MRILISFSILILIVIGCSQKDNDAATMIDYSIPFEEEEPTDYMDYIQRGSSKDYEKDYRGAIADYNKAIQLDPNNAQAYINRGSSKDYLKDYRGALTDYNKAIQLDPSYAFAYFNRGLTKLNLYDKENGCLDLSKAGELGYGKAYDLIKNSCN